MKEAAAEANRWLEFIDGKSRDSSKEPNSAEANRWLGFEEAKNHVHRLGLKSLRDWREYQRELDRTTTTWRIPANPRRVYREEWMGWADWLGTGYAKQKLTLTINRDVIKRAKKVGLNISELTERTLDILTYDLKSIEHPTSVGIVNAYNSLFSYTKSLLKKYNTTIQVGRKNNDGLSESILLLDGERGLLIVEGSNDELGRPIHIFEAVKFFFRPTIILENLLLAIIECEEKDKERMIELRFAIRFLKALSSEVV